MANPKRKHTRSRRDTRRSHNWVLSAPALGRCQQCGAPRAPHRVCPSCGYYRGELIAPPKAKPSKDKKE